ncbi:MAG TPA: response regulator transcription factor, partial [Actinomycetes bacterium]|nr:response regulator transcription factor [Actinomycetes bacterium]
GPLLALLVDVYLEQGSVDDAAGVARRLDRIAQGQRGPYLRAVAAFAEGRVRVASGKRDARACLHRALEGFARAQLPMEVARTHLEMARASSQRAPEVAIAEARAALQDFERLDAARHADAAGALLRSLGAPIRTGPKGTGALTKREAEVLQLIGAGLSNPEIADRLYITRKTVETHVGNLLAKLGLRNRAEAAAFVTRNKFSR